MSPGEAAEERGPFASRLGALVMLTALFTVNMTSRVILGPLLPSVERDLAIGHGRAGGLFLLLSLGYCAGLLAAGFVSARLTHRTTIALSSGVMAVALLGVGATTTVRELGAAVVGVGFGAGLYLPSGVAAITSFVSPGDWGKALAFHEVAPNLAFTAAPLLAEALLRVTSWRGVMVTLGVASLAAGALFAVAGRGGRAQG
ncbi:MAG: MFS transporter, partial [Deltaproteobacteria bacterium]|nr:MFS transporter [Deltaproteobacteria bacterium]